MFLDYFPRFKHRLIANFGSLSVLLLWHHLFPFLVGTTLLTLVCLIVERRLTFQLKGVGRIPWWVFTGGALGVLFVTSNILLLPLLGSAMTVVLALCGQMIIALIIDHFGFFGVIPHPINRYRMIGVLLMLVGVFLIQRF